MQKKSKKKGPRGNRLEIGLSAGIFTLLFTVMLIYLGYFVATNRQDMMNNSYNSRQQLLLSENYRGTIYAKDGEILAQSLLDAEQNETRTYPYANLFSHIVGYSTKGRMGVEALANYYLIQSNISLSKKTANDAAQLKNPGDNVYTTLDVTLQQIADEQLGKYQGAVVVTEVQTGKILAMVSHPDFNPNEISASWDELVKDNNSSVLLNRATQGLYPPGSTFKMITALEYIRENPESYADYTYHCNGSYYLEGRRISCYHGNQHGTVSFERSFAKSCNASFANLGMSLDRNALSQTLEELLFQQELPITLNYAKSSAPITDKTSDVEMLQNAIGQGKIQMTPIHLHMITSAVANDGMLMQPYVVDYVENAEGKRIKTFSPQSYGELMSGQEAAILTQLLSAVVTEGTASQLNDREYTAAGKTGSAEYNNTKGDSHAWFTGFAPAESPEICVTVIVEGAGSGSEYAVPVAKQLFDAYFTQKQEENR